MRNNLIARIVETMLIAFFFIVLIWFAHIFMPSVLFSMQVVVVFFGIVFAAAILFFLLTVYRPSKGVTMACIGLFSLGVCLLYSLNVRLWYEGDLAFYLTNAQGLTNETFTGPLLYQGIFPHTVTYPAFLAVFMRIFGTSDVVAIVINHCIVVLLVETVYLYASLFMSYKWALLTALLVALHPYIWIYANTINAELAFGLFCLFSLYAYQHAHATTFDKKSTPFVFYSLAAVCCAVANFFRPVAIILLVALCLHQVMYTRGKVIQPLCVIGVFVLIFALSSSVTHKIVEDITKYPPPTKSYGWNLYVGASANGRWNKEDAEEFARVEKDAYNPSDVQQYFASKALSRYKKIGIGLPGHSLDKLRTWVKSEYMVKVASQRVSASPAFFADDMGGYQTIIFVYDSVIMAMAFLGCFLIPLLRMRGRKPIEATYFFFAGSVSLFMILETAPRYTVSYRPLFCIFAVQLLHVAYTKGRAWYLVRKERRDVNGC